MADQPTEQRDALCGICPAGCWVRATLAHDGRLVSVEPQPDHPLGAICTIGRSAPAVVYDPDRVRTPLRRVGPKGSLAFEPVSWDAAMAEVAERLEALKAQHGPESTAIYTGRGSFDQALCDLFQPDGVAVSSAASVLFPFGSPNTLGVGALCYVSFAMIAPHVTFGEMLITLDPDIEQADLVVVWGANPATDSPPHLHEQIQAARRRGADVIVIDPRRNETARAAGAEWIPLRPGTDGALALGLIEVLIEEELYDEGFADAWTVGFDDLARTVQHFRPEAVERITGVPAETLRTLARRLARARGAAPVMYTGLEYSDSGVQAIRAVFSLWALAGQLDVPGGLLIRSREGTFPQQRGYLVANPDPRHALGRDRFPVYSEYRGESHAIALPRSVLEGEPYRVRGLLVLGGSIITSWPNPALWRRTLGALDFLVSIDRYLTADAAYADLVLPATTGFEITSFMRYGPIFRIRERVVEPVGEARNDFLILAELADRLGYGHLYPQTEEAVLERALEGTGFTVDEVRAAGGWVQLPVPMPEYKKWEKGRLRPDGRPGFDTPSGKFEIASSVLAEHGYNPLPVYTEPGEGPLANPALARRYPLVFNSGARTRYDFRSQHHGVAGLAEHHPVPRVWLNDSDAAARGIASGDWVWVETSRGRVRFVAHVTADIVPGAIDANMGGGGPLGSEAWQACNVNDLTDLERTDPISGFPVYKTLLCEVTRDEAGEASGARAKEAAGGGLAGGGLAPTDVEPPRAEPGGVEPVREVYLDNNATTAVDPAVLEVMVDAMQTLGANPSSVHRAGIRARDVVEAARRQVAAVLGCTARRVIFTGSGSEANNLALRGVLGPGAAAGGGRRFLVTSAVEHPAVLATARDLEAQGVSLTVLGVDARGRVAPADLEAALAALPHVGARAGAQAGTRVHGTCLVSVMLANNETGTILPVAELAALAHAHGALFHTDAVQALGKIPVDVADLDVDLVTVSAHKIHGPKGLGALYRRRGVRLTPLVTGGEQEGGLRAGTENVPGIVGFGKAAALAALRLRRGALDRVAALRDVLEAAFCDAVPGAQVNGDPEARLPNTTNLTLPGIRGESLVLHLGRHGVYFSSGSACKSGNPDPSHALLALGLSAEAAHSAVRLSLAHDTTADDIDFATTALRSVLAEAAIAVRFVGCR